MGRDVGVDADVRYDDTGAEVAREDVDRRPTAQEVEHHLRRDLARVGAHAFGRDPMVGGEGEHDRVVERWIEPAGHAGQANRELLQAPQAAGRLGEALLAFGRVAHRLEVERRNCVRHHGASMLAP